MIRVKIGAENTGLRIDKFLSELNDLELTRSAVVKLIESGNCEVNGAVKNKNYKVEVGDDIVLTIPEPEVLDIVPEDIKLDITYEDDDVIIVNKPRNMAVHPSNGHLSGTLVNALMWRFQNNLSSINGVIRPGIVHRIDKDTSGLLIVAKNDKSHLNLSEQFKSHSITREYEAIVKGVVKTSGIISAPLGRSATDRKKMSVITDKNKTSREAVTRYDVIANYEKFTHIKLTLETGRTHQIRVHASYIGFPIAGDKVYGNGKPAWLNGQCLHARKLGFVHPTSGEYMEFDSELPDYFEKMLRQIK